MQKGSLPEPRPSYVVSDKPNPPLPRGSRSGLLFFAALYVSGCIPALQTRLPDASIAPSQIVLLPPMFMAAELDFGGKKTPRPDWQQQMKTNLQPEFETIVQRFGGRVVHDGDAQTEALQRFWNWGLGASFEIAEQKSGFHDYERRSIGQWRYRGELAAMRTEIGSDLAMVVLFRDIIQSAGNVLGSVIGGVHYSFMRIAVVCLNDLRDGRMVWCEPKVDQFGDLRNPVYATRAVHTLLRDLYHLPPDPPLPADLRTAEY